ncbi:MAG: hypothetical protein IT247_08710, partial [Bacteroidia bacterium]|nr:hypothetical protein [Bacteroidia bacterium]
MVTIFRMGLKYVTVLFFLTSKLFAQSDYWPGPPVSYQQNAFFYLGKIIIHANIDNSLNRGYYLSLNNGLTWEKLTDPIFSTQRVINVEQSDSLFIVKTLTGYYLTTDFKTYQWAGKPHEEITIGSNKFILTNNEKIGYKSLWLKQHQITKSNAKTWFVSPDRGFTWTDISGGLLTSKETYV